MKDHILQRFHRDQNGAVALVMLAAFLALFMMGMVIYDSTMSVSDKLDVQAAADGASWSQSTIEARTMNMVAFTNVGKRVTVGMTSMYSAAIAANRIVIGILSGLTTACFALTACTPGPCQLWLLPVCNQLLQLTWTARQMQREESNDIDTFEDTLVEDYFGKDLLALDNYQQYMIDMTPWWGWAEGVLRGVQNGATTTSSFPAPDTLAGGMFSPLTSFVSQSGIQDRLPVGRGEQSGDPLAVNRTGNMCNGVTSGTPDQATFLAEFGIKTIPNLSGWREFVVAAMMVGLMSTEYDDACDDLMGQYGDAAQPIEVHQGLGDSRWQMYTSNLTLAYYADADRLSTSGDKRKLDFVPTEYNNSMTTNHDSPGYWALSRSEISYRGDQSVNEWKWNPRWTARMRPVALPGEWQGLGTDIKMKHAWRDMAPLLWATATVLDTLGMTNGNFKIFGEGGFVNSDALRMDSAATGMDDDLMDGAPK